MWRWLHGVLLGGLLAAIGVPTTAQAGKLDDTRRATRDHSSSRSSEGSSSRRGSSSDSDSSSSDDSSFFDDDDDDDDSDFESKLALYVLLSPITLPYFATEGVPPEDNSSRGDFVPYPYRGSATGSMVITRRSPQSPYCQQYAECGMPCCARLPEEAERASSLTGRACPAAALPPTRPYTLQLSTDFGTDVDLVYRYGFGLKLDTAARVGLESRFVYFVEPIAGEADDHLLIGDVNMTLRTGQHENVQFYFGLGLRLLLDPWQGENNGGLNATWSFDAYPGRPITLGGSVDVGNLGRALYLDTRGYLGAMVGRVQILAGYDATLVNPVLFHGPFAGGRIYF